MEKLTARKKLSVVRLYLSGLSYDDITSRTGVSKGTVANVVAELKAGSFPEAADVGEQVEVLRELSIDLKRSRLSPGQCATGLILLSRINELGLEPADIDRWPLILKSISNEDDAKEFVRLVYSIAEVQQRSGLGLEALNSKVRELEKKAADLEPVADKVQDCQKQLALLTRERAKLNSSVALLQEKRKLLTPQVKDLERRERTLSRRITDMEPKARKAEATLSTLKAQAQEFNDMGFTVKELAEFCGKLEVIAHHHDIEACQLRSRLLSELETLDKGLSLEAIVQSRQEELDRLKDALAEMNSKIEATRAVVGNLQQEERNLEDSIKETRKAVGAEIGKIVPLAQETVRRFGADMQQGTDEALAEVRRLREEVVNVGMEVGRCQGMLQVSEWLNDLMALVRGEEGVEGKRARTLVLPVVRGFYIWLKQHHSSYVSFQSVLLAVDNLVSTLEAWES